MAVIITDGVPFPDERRQPAIDEAEILRTEYSKWQNYSFGKYGNFVVGAVIAYFSHRAMSFILDIGLYSIGITNEIDESFLAAISGDVGVANGEQVLGIDYFKAPDFQVLNTILDTVSTGICERRKPSKNISILQQAFKFLFKWK